MRLNLAVGQVPVTFEFSDDGREVAWFLAPPMAPGATCAGERIAAALGISPEQGYEIRRPSLVMLRARMVGHSREVSVGGQVIATVQGQLL